MSRESDRAIGRMIAAEEKQERVASKIEAPRNFATKLSNLWKDNVFRDINHTYTPLDRARPGYAFGEVYGGVFEAMADTLFSLDSAPSYQGIALVGIAGGLVLGAAGLVAAPALLSAAAVAGAIGLAMEVSAGVVTLGVPLVLASAASAIGEGGRSIARKATQLVEHLRFPNGQPRGSRRSLKAA